MKMQELLPLKVYLGTLRCYRRCRLLQESDYSVLYSTTGVVAFGRWCWVYFSAGCVRIIIGQGLLCLQ